MSTMYWIGLKPGDVHLNISSPGWAKHAWSASLPRGMRARPCSSTTSRASAQRPLLEALVEHQITTLCAPPTVWRMLIQERLTGLKVTARGLWRRRAVESGDYRSVRVPGG